MANDRWYEQLESKIFTLVSHRVKKALKEQIKETIKCTSDAQGDSSPYFPTWYMHELSPVETGADLTGNHINAVIETVEVIVYTKDKPQCKMIMAETVHQMKQLSFSITALPVETRLDGGVYQRIARFRRLVGSGDTDLVSQD